MPFICGKLKDSEAKWKCETQLKKITAPRRGRIVSILGTPLGIPEAIEGILPQPGTNSETDRHARRKSIGQHKVKVCLRANVRIGIRRFGDARGQRLNFNAGNQRAAKHGFGHEANGTPDAAGGFEYATADGDAIETGQRLTAPGIFSSFIAWRKKLLPNLP